MTLSRFLLSLTSDGRLKIGGEPLDEDADANAHLVAWDRRIRESWPGEAPELDTETACWAAAFLYRVCQLLVYRDLPPEAVQQLMKGASPRRVTPSIIYSADLMFRFLPSLHAFARASSPGDPLTLSLLQLGRKWPFSSVGIQGVEPETVDVIVADQGVLRVYVDRIIHSADVSRLEDDRVREAVRAALGESQDLCPKLQEAIAARGTPRIDPGAEI